MNTRDISFTAEARRTQSCAELRRVAQSKKKTFSFFSATLCVLCFLCVLCASAVVSLKGRGHHHPRPVRKWASGSAAPALTSPSEKLVCRSFTCGKFNSTSSDSFENASRSVAITCSSNVPAPEM